LGYVFISEIPRKNEKGGGISYLYPGSSSSTTDLGVHIFSLEMTLEGLITGIL